MKIKTALAALTLAAALPMSLHAEDDIVARVNGEPVTEDMVDFYMMQKQRQLQGRSPDRDNLIKEVVDIELMIQDAEDKGLDQEAAVVKQLEFYRQNLLVNMAVRQYLQQHPVTEQEIKAAYEEQVEGMSGREYHARHILVEEKDTAEQIIDQLNQGADFAELAKEKSTGPTGERGGDLGWFSPDRMVPEFSDAVKDLDQGEVTQEPVKTQFGWHVIKLEDSRTAEPPALEEVRDDIVSQLRNERLNEYMASLREGAKIEYIEKDEN